MSRYFLYPCPGCLVNRAADEGHHLCRECEGYTSASKKATPDESAQVTDVGRTTTGDAGASSATREQVGQ